MQKQNQLYSYGHQERFCAALLPSTATLGSGSSAAILAAPTSPSLCGVSASRSSLREVMATTTEIAAARTCRFVRPDTNVSIRKIPGRVRCEV